ncbi:ferredoxin [soil metagenome]
MAEPRYRVHICQGPNCTNRGSRSLFAHLDQELIRLEIADQVEVLATSCRNRCEIGPSVNVYPGPIFYREVSTAVLTRIAGEHLANDQPVEEFVVEDERPEIDFSKLNLDF